MKKGRNLVFTETYRILFLMKTEIVEKNAEIRFLLKHIEYCFTENRNR